MKLLILSDIHLEFHKDGGKGFLESYEKVDHDVAIVAGDLCDNKILKQSIALLARNLNEVIYVIGNHECYGSSISSTVAAAHEFSERHPNVHYLEQQGICIEGRWFHGCALWFPYDRASAVMNGMPGEAGMTDFFQIKNIRSEVGEYNQKGADYLRRCVGPGDVVITHHLPSYECVDKKYKGSSLNRFFVGGIHDLYAMRSPRLHVFGHTHESVSMAIERTELVCNPYGYQGYETNKNFKKPMIIEL